MDTISHEQYPNSIYNIIYVKYTLTTQEDIKQLEDQVKQKESDLEQLYQQYNDVCTCHDIKAEML